MLDIEEQRWAPLASAIAPAPAGFGWSTPLPASDPWWDSMDTVDHHLLFDCQYADDGRIAGAYLNSKFTEFASAQHSWMPYTGSPDDIEVAKHTIFDGEPGRMINITSAGGGQYNVIFVPNTEGKWWGWGHGAPWDKVVAVVKGNGWKGFPADGIKRKLVALTMDPHSGHFMFILNEWKKGDAWWWGGGLNATEINLICDGKAAGDFSEDKISKRLVSAQGHRHFHTESQPVQVPIYEYGDQGGPPGSSEEMSETEGEELAEQYDPRIVGYKQETVTKKVEDDPHFIFLMVPCQQGETWHWYEHAHWPTIEATAAKNNMRIVDLKPFDSERFTAILLKNAA